MKKQKNSVRSVLSVLLVLCMLMQAFGVSMTAFAATNNVKGDVIGELNYTIDNPYKDVDWDTWYQYKGATHVHTHVSDGEEDVNEMIEKYYELGYHLMSLTDHGTVNYGWTVSKSRHTLFSYQSFVHGGVDSLSKEREAQIIAGVGRDDGIGMIDVPLGIELNGAATKKVHINSFFVDAGDGDMELDADWPSDAIAKSQRAVAPDGGKGVCHINHVGEWSGGNDDVGVYDDDFVNRFAQIFRDYDVCVGIELVNTSDGRTRNDRYLYDKLLMKLAPEGKNVFGFCEDDSHEFSDCGRNINYYIMPELTWQAARTSMTTGAFFASSKNAKTPDELGSGFTGTGDFPRISRIDIDEAKDQIILQTTKANKFKLVADGKIIETFNVDQDGETITVDLNAYEDLIGSYVRMYLTGPGGITYVQPFLLESTPSSTSTINFVIPYDGYEFTFADAEGNIIDPINSDNYFLVDAGTYYYSVSKFGFEPIVNASVTITQEQIDAGEDVTVEVELAQDSTASFLYFYVPETIYLDPVDSQTFSHYVDRANSPNGSLDTSARKQFGNVYFSCKGAYDVVITAETVLGEQLYGMSFAGGELTNTISTDADTISTTITSGSLSSSASDDAIIKWTATYMFGKARLSAVAYSYVYKLNSGYGSVAAAGGYAKTSKSAGWMHTSMSVTSSVWLAGVHSVSGGGKAYKFPYYGVGGSVGADGTGNLVVDGVGMNTASDDSNGGSVTVYPTGGTGHITIDTSRISNYSQIPCLAVGLDVNYAASTDGGSWDSPGNYLNFGDVSLYNEVIDNLADRSQQRIYVADNATANVISKPINTDETNIAIVGKVSGGKSSRTDTVQSTVYLAPTFVNKNQLRTLVNNEMMTAKQQSTIADQSAYLEYVEWMKNAYTVLGNPEASQAEVDNAVSKLNESTAKLGNKESTCTITARIDFLSSFLSKELDYALGSVVAFEVPEIDGYTFDKWIVYKNYAPFAEGTETQIELYADFEGMEIDLLYIPHEFNVSFEILDATFSVVGGTGSKATFGANYALPANAPEKTGYKFESWLLDVDGEMYDIGEVFVYNFESDAVFTAQYSPIEYTISYDLNGGDDFEPIGASGYSVEYDSTYSLPINFPTKPGYNFGGWILNDEDRVYSAGQSVTWTFPENGDFVAHWIPISYTVHFEAGEGATGSLESVVVDFDSPVVLPAYGSFEKTGYEQVAWSFEDGNRYVEGDSLYALTTEDGGSVTFTAVWGTQAYTLSFVTGFEGVSCNDVRVEYLGTYGNLPKPVCPGYTFDGWYTESDGGELITADTVVSVASDHEVYAHWSPAEYEVSFITNADSVACDPITVTYGETYASLPVPERTGYSLLGWYIDGKKVENDTVVTYTEDHSLTASWLANSYAVSFETVSDDEFNSITVTFDGTYGNLPVPELDGSWFRGWYYGSELITAESVVSVASNHTLTAVFEEKVSVEVSFDTLYGITVDSVNVIVEDVYGELPVPELDGYTFAGWYLGDVAVTASTVVTQSENHTLTASWTANDYDVSFDTGDENIKCKDISVTFNSAYGTLPEPFKYGYSFNGWMLDGEAVTEDTTVAVAGDHTLVADWEPLTFTVSFETGFEDVTCDSIEVVFDGTYEDIPQPEVPGYIFLGWYYVTTEISSVSKVTLASDHTLTARWSNASFIVSFDEDGGTECSDIAVTYLSPYSNLPTTQKSGYTFGGWLYEGSVVNNDTIVTVTGAHVLKAMWIADTYTVSFDSSGGSSVRDITVTFGQPYGTLPLPVLSGFVFDYWTLNGRKIFADTVVYFTSDHTLIANWKPIQYLTVSFDSNGGSPINVNISVVNGDTYGDLETPVLNGYEFGGWYYNDTLVTSNTVVTATENHTLVAKWSPLPYTITFDSNGGDDCNPITVYHDGTYENLPVPTRENYDFDGWYYGDVRVDNGSPLALDASHTLTAGWSAIKVTVSFDSNGGSYCEPIEVSYGYTYSNLPKPSYPGYSFNGWTYEGAAVNNSTRMNLTEDHTLVATWVTGKTYTVSFVDTNGVTVCDPVIVAENELFFAKLPVPELEGRTFKYWYYGDDYSVAIDETYVYNYGEDITLTAYSSLNKYNVSFDAHGGTVSSETKSVTYSQRYGTLPTPTHERGEFLGWYLNGALVTSASTVLTGADHTLVAKWKLEYIIISFDTGDDEVTVDSINVDPQGDYGTLPVPVRDGYEFDYWMYNGAEVNDNDELRYDIDHTLVAKWTKLYELTWIIGDETYVDVYKLGDAVNEREIPDRIGYEKRWDTTVPTVMPNKNITITALYTPIVYTITWVSEIEEFVDEYYYEDEVTFRDVPEKIGFLGVWDKQAPDTMPAENIVITASYTPILYTVTWIIGENEIVQEYYYDDEIDVPELPELVGHIAEWSIVVPEFMPDTNLTISAVYTPVTHTITWIVEGEQIVTYHPYLSAVVPYDFPIKKGHSAEWDKAVPEFMPDEDLEFTMIYTPNSYEITYENIEDAEFEFEAPTVHNYGVRTYVPNVSKQGYTFDGWILNGINYGTDLVISATAFDTDMTLVPTWVINTYSVVVKTSDGGVVKVYVDGKFVSPEKGVIKLDYGTEIMLKPLSVCGYELSNITATSNGQTVSLGGDLTFSVDGDVTFKAVYAKSDETHRVTVNGGTINKKDSELVPMYGTVSVVADEPEAGMKFSHWAIGDENGKCVSYDSIYTFIAVSDIRLTAVYVEENETVEKQVIVNTYDASDAHISKVNGGNSLSYYGVVSLPEEYEIVEFGLLLTNKDSSVLTSDEFVIGAEGTATLKSTIINEFGQAKITVNNVEDSQTRTGRFYLVYTDGIDTFTVYSDSWSTLTVEA